MAKIPSGIGDGQLMWTASYFYCTNIEGSYVYSWNDSMGVMRNETRSVIGNHARLPFRIPQVRNRIYIMFASRLLSDIQ